MNDILPERGSLGYPLVLDSSVVISCFGQGDEYSEMSRRFFKEVASKLEALLPTIVFVEVAVNLYLQKVPNVRRALGVISGFKQIALDSTFAWNCAKFAPSNRILRTSDFIIAVSARVNEAVLITWDKRLLDNGVCEAVTPSEFLKKITKVSKA